MNNLINKIVKTFEKDLKNDNLNKREIVFTTASVLIGVIITAWYLYITSKVIFISDYSWMNYIKEYLVTAAVGTLSLSVTYLAGGFTGSLKLTILITKKIFWR